MRKVLFIALLVLGCGSWVFAQDYSKGEFYGGYQYLHIDTGNTGVDNSWPAGFGLDGTYYFTKNIGLTADFGYNKHDYSGGTNAHIYEFLFGPRFKARFGKLEPFADAGFGISHGGLQMTSTTVTANAFTMALGGGLDVGVAKHFAVRLGEFHYVYTRFATGSATFNPNGSDSQNNFAFGAGIVIR